MISIYDRNETDFTHNGIVLTDTIECTIEEVLNGKYVLELTHPIDKKGKWEYLTEENIIKAGSQLFRIYSTEKNLNYVYAYARHIFYDLLHNFLEDVRVVNMNGAAALDWILSSTQYPHNFTGMSDIETINTQYFIRKNPVEAILGEDSLVTRWGGEIVRDNFTIKLLNSRGQKKGAKIAYGKNLLGLEIKRDMDTVITRIMPVGRDGLTLPEKYVDSPLINNYVFPRIQKIEFDIGIDENTTEEEAYEQMRQACMDLYEKNKIDIPYININANLLLLENTEEYKHLKHLEKVELGDIVSCTDNPLNITFESKVIRIKKDVLSNRNIEVELGQFKESISSTIQNKITSISNTIKDISEEIKNTTSDLEEAIENATELLTNALGGYVLKRAGELLIMDTEDPETAQKVWRWNLNGLGYSDNGINGPYRLAMTMDGQIVADFITAGTLDASLIKTGVLSSDDNSSWLNMDDGSFNFKNSLKWEDGKLKITSPDIPDITPVEDAIENIENELDKTIKQEEFYNGVQISSNEGVEIYDNNNNKVLQVGGVDKDGDGEKDTYGFQAIHEDGSRTTIDKNGVDIRGGNIKIYDSEGKLILDGKGVNPLETSGWGITDGLTFEVESLQMNDYIAVKVTETIDLDEIETPFYLYVDDVSQLGSSGRLDVIGSNTFYGIYFNYDEVDTSNKRIRVVSGRFRDTLYEGDFVYASMVDGTSIPAPSGIAVLKFAKGSAILKNGKYVSFNEDFIYNLPVSIGFSDSDGWQYRVLWIGSDGEIKNAAASTIGVIDSITKIAKYPSNPREENIGEGTPDPNAVILGAVLCGTGRAGEFSVNVFMHPDFRDERAVKVTTSRYEKSYLTVLEKSVLASSPVTHDCYIEKDIYLSSGEEYEITIPIGKGKRIAIVSLSSAENIEGEDDSSKGAVMFVGLQDPYYKAWQPRISIGYNNKFFDGFYKDTYGEYIVDSSSLGWNYRRIKDAFLKIGGDGLVHLHVILHQYSGSETRNIRISWFAF